MDPTNGTIRNTMYGGSVSGLTSSNAELITLSSRTQRIFRWNVRGSITANTMTSMATAITSHIAVDRAGATKTGRTSGFIVNNRSSIPRGAIFSRNVAYWLE